MPSSPAQAEDGDGTHHYLNITWGEAMANPLASSTSTATSALGHLLTKGTFLAAGTMASASVLDRPARIPPRCTALHTPRSKIRADADWAPIGACDPML